MSSVTSMEVTATLTARGAQDVDLGTLAVSGTVPVPPPAGGLLQLAGLLRDGLRDLWQSHYGPDQVTESWALHVAAIGRDGAGGSTQVFTILQSDTLPLDFQVVIAARLASSADELYKKVVE